jgi:hypothetical protein
VTTELKNADQLGNTELISVILEGSLPVFFQPPSLTAAPGLATTPARFPTVSL